jgi:hypothetical protein
LLRGPSLGEVSATESLSCTSGPKIDLTRGLQNRDRTGHGLRRRSCHCPGDYPWRAITSGAADGVGERGPRRNDIQAIDDVADGQRDVLITTEGTADGVRVGVRDSGPGLSPEKLERIFEPFYTTKPDGMGMGLSICRSIIEAHGGRLWATRNEPRGAVFQFTLLASRAE